MISTNSFPPKFQTQPKALSFMKLCGLPWYTGRVDQTTTLNRAIKPAQPARRDSQRDLFCKLKQAAMGIHCINGGIQPMGVAQLLLAAIRWTTTTLFPTARCFRRFLRPTSTLSTAARSSQSNTSANISTKATTLQCSASKVATVSARCPTTWQDDISAAMKRSGEFMASPFTNGILLLCNSLSTWRTVSAFISPNKPPLRLPTTLKLLR